jgi:hypothetical protein
LALVRVKPLKLFSNNDYMRIITISYNFNLNFIFMLYFFERNIPIIIRYNTIDRSWWAVRFSKIQLIIRNFRFYLLWLIDFYSSIILLSKFFGFLLNIAIKYTNNEQMVLTLASTTPFLTPILFSFLKSLGGSNALLCSCAFHDWVMTPAPS